MKVGKVAYATIALTSLGLVGLGAGMIYLPAGLIAVGLLIWLDLNILSRRINRRRGA